MDLTKIITPEVTIEEALAFFYPYNNRTYIFKDGTILDINDDNVCTSYENLEDYLDYLNITEEDVYDNGNSIDDIHQNVRELIPELKAVYVFP